MIRPALLAAAIGLAGCSQQPEQGPAPTAANVTVAPPAAMPPAGTVVAPPQESPPKAPVQPTPKPPEPPTAFEYPPDLGGRAVAKAVAPTVPDLPPGEAFGTAPRRRTPPAQLFDPDPTPKPAAVPPPVLPPKPPEVKPVAPREGVPPDLGARADAVPAKPTFPVAAGITERARDVNLPPAVPALGRQLGDRASLEDPALEHGHAAIVSPVVSVPLAPAPFLKVAVPDPFELAEQVRPRVTPAAEPGLLPVVVNPQRVK